MNLEPDKKQLEDADEDFWRWVFSENDGPGHPLKVSDGGKAQLRRGNLLILAGSLPDDETRNRSLNIPLGVDFIFVPGENCVYTEVDKDGQNEQELIDKANNDLSDSEAKVFLNGQKQQIYRLPGHKLSPLLHIEKCIDGAGKSGKGEGESCIKNNPPGQTRAAAACDYAIIPANTLKGGDKIKIEGTGRAGPNQKRGRIKVTYQVE